MFSVLSGHNPITCEDLCLCFTVLLIIIITFQGKLPLLLSRMKEVGKVFLATNSDYKYTDVSA